MNDEERDVAEQKKGKLIFDKEMDHKKLFQTPLAQKLEV